MNKNVKINNPMKVITGPDTRWSYANVWEPKSINGGTPKYSVSFDAVSAELSKRSTQLGRNDRYIAPIIKRPPTAFQLGDITENYENPVRQAEYLYSLIESEVK